MIRITVEMLPHGFERGKYHLGTAYITNDGTGDKNKASYTYRISRRGAPNSAWKKGIIKDFPKSRLLIWDLLFRVLKDAIGSRN